MIRRSIDLGARIRGAREAQGLSREALCERLGWSRGEARSNWSPRSLVRLEQGERDVSPGDLAMLAETLGVTTESLDPSSHGVNPATSASPLSGPDTSVHANVNQQGDTGAHLASVVASLSDNDAQLASDILERVLGIVELIHTHSGGKPSSQRGGSYVGAPSDAPDGSASAPRRSAPVGVREASS